jgi:TRAP-type transport system small permease protein
MAAIGMTDQIDAGPGDLVPPAAPRPGLAARAAFAVGAIGLALATCSDALAVLGRHAGFTLLGSIEIVQLAVVLVASAAMIGATLQGAHASVHIITDRLAPATRTRLGRVTAWLCALYFLIVAIGSIWVAADLWGGHERTELLGIPLRLFRLLWIAAALFITLLFVRAATRRSTER